MSYRYDIKEKYEIILAIETSCDETSAAILKDGRDVLSLVISSQIKEHQKYGGVVPEVASRKHMENISSVVNSCLKEAGKTFEDIDAIAVTKGPGLVGALLVGVSYAKGLALSLNVPFVGVHHIDGHISSNYITHRELKPPYLCLVVSGGHSLIAECTDYGEYTVLGTTRDDAAGEAFDKGARLLGLPYPGGREIDELAKKGDSQKIAFPRAKLSGNQLDFSYSGVKTALRQHVHKIGKEEAKKDICNIAASYQEAIIDVLVENTKDALIKTGHKVLSAAGGVAANSRLRSRMQEMCDEIGVVLYLPEIIYCGDNAAMIGAAGYEMLKKKQFGELNMNAQSYIQLGEEKCF
ncbi:MAG: tRNA (adenosine(37)-N6)-threonylcarbamoyltransferase complex transferase subunit TsaD [Eubacteriales bacterium]